MTDDIAQRLRDLADELEAESGPMFPIPDELRDAAPAGTTVHNVAAEGWNCASDYVVAIDSTELSVDSRSTKQLNQLSGYEIGYVVWGDQTCTSYAPVELCISEVDE